MFTFNTKSWTKSWRRLALAGVTSVMAGLCAGAATAETVIKMGWATADNETDPYAVAARNFASAVEEAMPGKYAFQFFGNHQLGDETQMLQGMQLGTLDMGVYTSTYVGSIAPAFQLNDLPFIYGSYDQANTMLDGQLGTMMFDTLDGTGLVGLAFAQGGFRNVINNVRPVTNPDDLAGIRLRVQPSDLFIDSFRAFGGNPVPMSWADVFTAAQQGTVDGLEIPLPVIYTNKFPEVTEYLSMTKHAYNGLVIMIAESTWNKMSDEDKAAFQAAAKSAVTEQRRTMAEIETDIVAKITAAGMQVNEVEDLSLFREKVSDIYDSYRGKIGPDIFDFAMEQIAQ